VKKASLSVLRPVLRPVGFVLYGLAAAMVLCALCGVAFTLLGSVRPGIDDGGSTNMLVAAGITAAAGFLLQRSGTRSELADFTRRDAILMTAGIWLLSGIFGALPYVLDAGMSPADAIFETISGFTTTGATVVTNIEGTLSRPVLLWRALTHWLGGMGIVVLFVAIFPRVGAGGKHLFRAEVPGPTSGAIAPRIGETAVSLYAVYVAMTAVLTGLLVVLGMQPFEAICHSFATVSTGGFSTRDASVAAFASPAIDVTLAIGMIASGVNFGLYFGVLRARRLRLLLESTELRAYLVLVAVVTLTMAFANRHLYGGDVLDALRHALFATATFITSTGFLLDDYMKYPSASLGLILLVMWTGACAGSTAGGIKMARVVLVLETLVAQVRRNVQPSVVQVVRLGDKRVPDGLLLEVSAFICLYVALVFAFTWVPTVLDGVPLGTAFGATLSAISNMGPAPFYQGSDNYAGYSDTMKLVFAFEMVLGRLEFMTLLALVIPEVWEP
jgi:trk system potassium uptake protein TrkH